MDRTRKILVIAPYTPQVYVALILLPKLNLQFSNVSCVIYTQPQHFHHFDELSGCELTDTLELHNSVLESLFFSIYIGHSFFINEQILTRLQEIQCKAVWINAHFEKEDLIHWRETPRAKQDLIQIFSAIFYEDSDDASALRSIGFKAKQLFLVGCIKYDCANANPWQIEKAKKILGSIGRERAPVIVAASIANTEESEIIVKAFKALSSRYKSLTLVLAPRNLEHVELMAKQLSYIDLSYQFSSKAMERKAESVEVLLIDNVGLLKGFFYNADVAVMGRSFFKQNSGGSNIIEPAAAALPILVGPFVNSFQGVLNDFKSEKAIIQLADSDLIKDRLQRLLDNPLRAKSYGRRAYNIYQRRLGAVSNITELLHSVIE